MKVKRQTITTFGGLRRSELMARVRGKGNASTELVMRALLRGAELSGWRRHLSLPGKPDFAWRERKVAVFVDGCFWHAHRTCGRNLTPAANKAYWQGKIRRNLSRDRQVNRELRAQGWTVVRIWECTLNRSPEACVSKVHRALRLR